jgi:hypothetical protein
MRKFKISYSYVNREDISGDAIIIEANDFGHAEETFRNMKLPNIKDFIGIISISRINMEKWSEKERN